MMNDHDRSNLNFLLAASEETLADWYQSATDDDLAYAQELLQVARSELTLQALEVIDNDVDENFEQAKTILEQFTLAK
jgi:hypothetical protein